MDNKFTLKNVECKKCGRVYTCNTTENDFEPWLEQVTELHRQECPGLSGFGVDEETREVHWR